MDTQWNTNPQLYRWYVVAPNHQSTIFDFSKLSSPEFYPYFRFLGAHYAEDADEFSKQFGNITKVRRQLISLGLHADEGCLGRMMSVNDWTM